LAKNKREAFLFQKIVWRLKMTEVCDVMEGLEAAELGSEDGKFNVLWGSFRD